MYKTLLAIEDKELLEQVKKLTVWGEASGFVIEDTVEDGMSASYKLREKNYDLVIAEIRLQGIDGLALLKDARENKLCCRIVLCSEVPDFAYARQGIVLGAYDYIVEPFDEAMFYAIFSRINREVCAGETEEENCAGKIMEYFKNRDDKIYGYLEKIFAGIYAGNSGAGFADQRAAQICKEVCQELLVSYPWMVLYFDSEDFCVLEKREEKGGGLGADIYKEIIFDFYREFSSLYPKTSNPKIAEIILYILSNPENDLRQKTIADVFYINSSYLSTVFYASTGIRFVDYLTQIKLKRAAWLLRNTRKKVVEIAARLDYKDVGYFSRLFRAAYYVTPSEYRLQL